MKFIFATLFTVLLLNINFVSGQVNHELKIDVASIFHNEYVLSYEPIFADRIGVEFALGFDFQKFRVSEFDSTSIHFFKHSFSSFRLNSSLGGKYYFSFKPDGKRGWFIGPYIRMVYLVNREDGAIEKWEEETNLQADERLRSYGAKDLNYGLHFGYKWIIKDSFIIEFVVTATFEKEIGVGARSFDEFPPYTITPILKAGYRF